MCIINMYESVRQVHKMDYTVLDLEMTGLAPKRDKVIEIGAVRVRNGEIAARFMISRRLFRLPPFADRMWMT